ncbi:helix-turn-helix protein [Halohasta litchfieldiae]|jgi:predicted transcriptional regulator|uniref:winged helix-turn-helix domain-containing protein n=1 Tax=Halohasta litchfieldiae TaxID=1073996 RepID=UPI000B7DB84F|nr:helix-turn-helix domain-containing protein [Halohasta litchfieldiae]ATW88351.1 helix-turn-helix protein [Halohasta litchfieldiae]
MDEDRHRNEDGQYEPAYSDEDILSAVRKHEPAATQEIANEFDIARQSADYRLRKLVKQGTVNKKKVGNSLVWSIADDFE